MGRQHQHQCQQHRWSASVPAFDLVRALAKSSPLLCMFTLPPSCSSSLLSPSPLFLSSILSTPPSLLVHLPVLFFLLFASSGPNHGHEREGGGEGGSGCRGGGGGEWWKRRTRRRWQWRWRNKKTEKRRTRRGGGGGGDLATTLASCDHLSCAGQVKFRGRGRDGGGREGSLIVEGKERMVYSKWK